MADLKLFREQSLKNFKIWYMSKKRPHDSFERKDVIGTIKWIDPNSNAKRIADEWNQEYFVKYYRFRTKRVLQDEELKIYALEEEMTETKKEKKTVDMRCWNNKP